MSNNTTSGIFPSSRMRRGRKSEWSRNLVRENTLSVNDLIWPVFIEDGNGKTTEIPSMPGVFRHSIDRLIPEIEKAAKAGIPAVALFPQTPQELKHEDGREALNPDNLVCRTTRAIKVNDFAISADLAF